MFRFFPITSLTFAFCIPRRERWNKKALEESRRETANEKLSALLPSHAVNAFLWFILSLLSHGLSRFFWFPSSLRSPNRRKSNFHIFDTRELSKRNAKLFLLLKRNPRNVEEMKFRLFAIFPFTINFPLFEGMPFASHVPYKHIIYNLLVIFLSLLMSLWREEGLLLLLPCWDFWERRGRLSIKEMKVSAQGRPEFLPTPFMNISTS